MNWFKKYNHLAKIYFINLIIFTGSMISSCSGPTYLTYPRSIPPDTLHVPQPEPVRIHPYAEYFDKQIMTQVSEALNFPRQYRNVTDNRKEAKNIDDMGEVPNSSWFTNRIGSRSISLKDLVRGSNKGIGPDTSGIWTIIRAKAEGVTPGFTIRDGKGDSYVIKFDPIGYPEMASGSEVISTKLFYAMGYNTPENYLVFFSPEKLRLGQEVKFTDKKGKKRFMNQQDLQELLASIQTMPSGQIRALASKYLNGVPIGPFKYRGVRKDDLNDVIPHHHRRELRGLRIFAAWLNHFDTKDGNTLDMYITEGGRSFVKHYLIDFGATLGSASKSPNFRWRGFQHDIDPGVIVSNIFSLGLYVRPWEKKEGVIYPSVGIYYPDLFDPMKYKPQVPNPAFENMTLLDGYWAAKIVMSFTDEHLQAVIKEARYSDPQAEVYLLETVKVRRDKIGEYFFNQINPLDNFIIHKNDGAEWLLSFENLAVHYGFADQQKTKYQYIIQSDNDKNILEGPAEINNNRISLKSIFNSEANKNSTEKTERYSRFNLKLTTGKFNTKEWHKPVILVLAANLEDDEIRLLSVKRQR